MNRYIEALADIGPEQIIVDLPIRKTEGIRILARYPNGAIKVPEFSFNPQKWADAYELQKRTGYVFCPRDVAPIVSLAAKIVFLARFGVVMSTDADGYIKANPASPSWLIPLVAAEIIDQDTLDILTSERASLLSVRSEDLRVPDRWIEEEIDIAATLAVNLQGCLNGGLTSQSLLALGDVLACLYKLVDTWFSSHRVSAPLENEDALQVFLRDGFRMGDVKVEEGSVVGGGRLDLYLNESILLENKFHDRPSEPQSTAKSAGMQGRRYAIALGSQIVIVISAYQPKVGEFPRKVDCISVNKISKNDSNRAEIRLNLPFGAVVPSREKADT